MKIILQLLVSIILCGCLSNPEIEFLSKEQGAINILDESLEPYFSKLQIREIEAFIGENVPTKDIHEARMFAKEKFSSAVIDFTEQEKQCISFVISEVCKTLNKSKLSLMPNHPWRFIKIKNWLCGGFAHTRGTFIILSQRHIDYLSKGWSNNMTKDEENTLIRKFGSLLVHEQMHSLQRRYKDRFTKLYTKYWDFVNAKVSVEKSIQVDQVSNPDAPIAEWLIPNNKVKDSYYWVRTIFQKCSGVPVMGRDFKDVVFTVEKNNEVFVVKKNTKGEIISTTLLDIDFYGKSFPVKKGLDHPNEISAYMFADYFESLYSGKVPFQNINPEAEIKAKQFLKWVKSEMK